MAVFNTANRFDPADAKWVRKASMERPVICCDTETTCFNRRSGKVIQLAVLKWFSSDKPIYSGATYLNNQGVPISEGAKKVHGIDCSMINEAKTFDQIAERLFRFLNGCIITGWNVKAFDVPFLQSEFDRIGVKWEPKLIFDGLLFERKKNKGKLIQGQKICNKLGSTYKRYTGNEIENAHDAKADTEATWEIISKYQLKLKIPTSEN